jgi:hypothetical protein
MPHPIGLPSRPPAARGTTFCSDRTWHFATSPDHLWEQLTAIEQYPTWWPWLQRFQPIGGFQTGARWACSVSPPLPYDVAFSVLLDRVDPTRSVHARVVGDISGDARLTIVGSPGGCTAQLRSNLAPATPLLRRVGAVMRPVVEWGHDWVLDQGQRQFLAAALPVGPS